MTIIIKPDPEHPGRKMLCAESNGKPVGAHLALGILPIPEGPVRNLSVVEAVIMAAKWNGFMRQQAAKN